MRELTSCEINNVCGGFFGWAATAFVKGWNYGGGLSSFGQNYDNRYLMQAK
ncbi:hypothetical protein [Shewanella benthica]|uniref:hypothetical protein n=1 Tax=Shewanella benthica TaxID=43661 RepID=UPI0002FA9BCB|nr:hypothetical protein [Shewanella benthica]